MIVTILGNGPSRNRWDSVGDIVIGCHGGEGVDYLCTLHPEQGWSPTPTIIGVRQRPQINPETPLALANFSWNLDGRVDRVQVHGLLVALPAGQNWDTGTVAILWALYTYPKAQINLWGFDRLWSSQYESISESNLDARSWGRWSGYDQRIEGHPRIQVCGRP